MALRHGTPRHGSTLALRIALGTTYEKLACSPLSTEHSRNKIIVASLFGPGLIERGSTVTHYFPIVTFAILIRLYNLYLVFQFYFMTFPALL